MDKINSKAFLAATLFFVINLHVFANDKTEPVLIPILENAHVFADLTDNFPAVLNYFTSSSEAQIIQFYNQNFGDMISQESKRDRLTLHYQKGEQWIRVVISQQNTKRQVDIIVMKTDE